MVYRQPVRKGCAFGSGGSNRVGVASERRLNGLESLSASRGTLKIQRQPLRSHLGG